MVFKYEVALVFIVFDYIDDFNPFSCHNHRQYMMIIIIVKIIFIFKNYMNLVLVSINEQFVIFINHVLRNYFNIVNDLILNFYNNFIFIFIIFQIDMMIIIYKFIFIANFNIYYTSFY